MGSLTTQEERELLRDMVHGGKVVMYCPYDAVGALPLKRVTHVDLSGEPKDHKAWCGMRFHANLYNTPLWMYKQVLPITLEKKHDGTEHF